MSNFETLRPDGVPETLLMTLEGSIQTFANQIVATQHYCAGLSKYTNEFLLPYLASVHYFNTVEREKLLRTPPLENFQAYAELMGFNLDLSNRNLIASMRVVNEYVLKEFPNAMAAFSNTLFGTDGEDMAAFTARQARMIESVTRVYPQAIRDAEPEFGFHFERNENIRFAETDRFILYQILPTDRSVRVRENGKPVLILPPFVLGANILAFLPGENRSYTHCFANQGIPTYIRVMKDIQTTPPLQAMTPEDDALDTRFFCEKIMERHGKPVTLNGYCQGGFSAVCDLLSGELDGLVDALITCVSPMDGTRSTGLADFLKNLPQRFNDLAYGSKTLPGGNKVADGELMGWVYKLKSIEFEAPVVAFFRDMMMLRPRNGNPARISKTAAALNYWLKNERSDLPLGITRMSFASYTTPITSDGTLPVRMFGRPLNFRRIPEKGIKWLICYGERDDLVEKATALAPLDYIEAETSAFPKGHVAIATSWSDPTSACALHTRFGDKNYRGPVRFQLDLDKDMSDARKKVHPIKLADSGTTDATIP
ncbi:poly(R)-hydroxyalkanoic acid synthase, class III, PhaC subunit [Desulfonema ishimotonii]|uniref:Poly(R)-hydroxyalkanoic acid synthase, class III, PhaC subunit n=1 Tax=Desulfonema ishimotonii TaxID=45657 RepID=A0A401G301_9BACT|nr:metal transporter [Desulfonema ishimotonii]GBC63607.1 poly(R)-hydroxyalkanoic acid synthase, class III, PhaC subunit [Desulfonema ishimotonii]